MCSVALAIQNFSIFHGAHIVVFQPRSLLSDIYRRQWKIKHVTSSHSRRHVYIRNYLLNAAISRADKMLAAPMQAVPTATYTKNEDRLLWGEASPKRRCEILCSSVKSSGASPDVKVFHRPDNLAVKIIEPKLQACCEQIFYVGCARLFNSWKYH